MRVLVAVASKYGATREIAEAIGRGLAAHGLEVEVRDVTDTRDLASVDAVILGSAVYAGRWLEGARAFVDEHEAELAAHPTWLFSSGPIGDPPRPTEDEAVHIDEIVQRTNAREHRVFAGKLDRTKLSFGERAIAFAFHAAVGDFRDWDGIATWANEIADALATQPSSNPSVSA
jgi:menaquinone-dependent protoporphyrinogen oxidase